MAKSASPVESKPPKVDKAVKKDAKEKKPKKEKAESAPAPEPVAAAAEPIPEPEPVVEAPKEEKPAKASKSKKAKAPAPAPPAEETTIIEETVQEEPTETISVSVPVKKRNERSFTIEEARRDSREGEVIPLQGKKRYVSANPAGAARKSCSAVFREIADKDDDNVKVFVVIRETTKDSKKDVYRYTAMRTLAKEKREVKFAGMPEGKNGGGINFRYNIDLKSAREVKRRAVEAPAVEAAA